LNCRRDHPVDSPGAARRSGGRTAGRSPRGTSDRGRRGQPEGQHGPKGAGLRPGKPPKQTGLEIERDRSGGDKGAYTGHCRTRQCGSYGPSHRPNEDEPRINDFTILRSRRRVLQ